jgi:hypothetical protein
MEPKLTPTFADLNSVEPRHEPYTISVGTGGVGAAPQPYTLSSVTPLDPPKVERKIAIIGTAPSSRDLAPYGDPSWEIWACSPGNQKILPRVTRWMEIHVNLHWNENKHYGLPYIDWLREQVRAGAFPGGLWMQDQRYIAEATTFPKDALVAEFGPYFFTSTFAWCMALAIHEGVSEVSLFGVDMASRDEFILQRPGGHYFIQECRRRGIKVSIPHESDLEQPPGLYGYTENTPFLRKLLAREQELKGRVAQLEQQFNAAREQMTYLKGALEDIDYQKTIWSAAQHGVEFRDYTPKNGNGSALP